ncbi:unnamed protein product, partial [Phaeothamnion confervicola]
MDAFYAQVEQGLDLTLKGRPTAVVQYNPHVDNPAIGADCSRIMNDSNGSIIAVSYEARAHGIKRQMRGSDARKLCPQLQLVQVPTKRQKADLTVYRESGARVVGVLSRGGTCERASIDEAYVDFTDAATELLARAEKDPAALGTRPTPAAQADAAQSASDGASAGKGSADDGDATSASGAEEAAAPAAALAAAAGAAAGSATAAAVAAGAGSSDVTEESRLWLARPDPAWTPDERLLVCGAAVANRLRAAVRSELGYTCSAGGGHNKMFAKLASGMHKPTQQT